MQRSVTVLTMPQPFASETLSCAAKSVGRTEVVLRMTCRVLSLGLAREMYLVNWHIFGVRTDLIRKMIK
jgi:hypothetical protein